MRKKKEVTKRSKANSISQRKNPMGVAGTSPELEKVLARALLDSSFRVQLFEDRDVALANYSLNSADLQVLRLLDIKTLEGAREVAVIVGMVCAVGGES